jgi:hypothetical protein
MKKTFLWPAVLLALAWQCRAIEITPSVVNTVSNFSADTGARFTIKNTSAVDSITIDTVIIRKLSPTVECYQIGFTDSASGRMNSSYIVGSYDSTFVSRLGTPLSIPPKGSLVLIRAMVGNCLYCVGIAGTSASDQCILEATFVPTKGARDSAIFIGPRLTGGTKSKIQSRAVVSGRLSSSMRLYDLSGRCVDKMSVRKSGVYISTYGQGILEKRVMFGD